MAVKMTVFAIGLVIGGLLPKVIVGTVFSQADVSKELVGALLSLLGLIIVILIHRKNTSWRTTLHGSLGAGFVISALFYYVSVLAVM